MNLDELERERRKLLWLRRWVAFLGVPLLLAALLLNILPPDQTKQALPYLLGAMGIMTPLIFFFGISYRKKQTQHARKVFERIHLPRIRTEDTEAPPPTPEPVGNVSRPDFATGRFRYKNHEVIFRDFEQDDYFCPGVLIKNCEFPPPSRYLGVQSSARFNPSLVLLTAGWIFLILEIAIFFLFPADMRKDVSLILLVGGGLGLVFLYIMKHLLGNPDELLKHAHIFAGVIYLEKEKAIRCLFNQGVFPSLDQPIRQGQDFRRFDQAVFAIQEIINQY